MECLDAIYRIAHSDARDLEPGLDWALVLLFDNNRYLLDMDKPPNIF